MLTYGDDKKREAFRAAIEQAREDGLSLEDMAIMITAAKNETSPTNGVNPQQSDDVIYEPGKLPEGPIGLPGTATKNVPKERDCKIIGDALGYTSRTIRRWANGETPLHETDRQRLQTLPPEIVQSLGKEIRHSLGIAEIAGTRTFDSATEYDPDTIYEPDQLPEGLIDLPSACKEYGLNRGRLTMWLKRGRIPRLGKLKGAAPGGGFVVTSITAIEECLRSPPNKGGRPPKKTRYY